MRILIVAFVALSSFGCATIVNGRDQEIPVTSDPPGAAVSLSCDGVPATIVGTTPATVKLRRKAESCVIEVAHPQYAARTVALERKLSRAVYGNVVPGATVTFAGIITAVLQALDGRGEDRSSLIVIGAAALGFGVPLAIDNATGAMFKHEPERIDIELQDGNRP